MTYVIRRMRGTSVPIGAPGPVNLRTANAATTTEPAARREWPTNDIPTTAVVKWRARCASPRATRDGSRAFRNAMLDSASKGYAVRQRYDAQENLLRCGLVFVFAHDPLHRIHATALQGGGIDDQLFYFPKGKAIDVPVEKLAEEGTEYVVRGWHFSNDIFRVSRSSGEFSYATTISRFDHPAHATGVCEAKQQKLRF